MEAIAVLKGMLKTKPPDYDLDAVRAECEAKDRELAAGMTRKAANA